MSTTAEQTMLPMMQRDWPPCCEITIRTWLTDADAAADLAIQVSEGLTGNDQVDATATTICLEDGHGEPERVYFDVVTRQPERGDADRLVTTESGFPDSRRASPAVASARY